MKTRYVYYDKGTGFIGDILSSRKAGRAPYIECDNSDVVGFIMGTESTNDYVVAYNKRDDKHILIEKNNVVAFRKQSKELYKIPYKKNGDSDITLVQYQDNVLEVNLDMSRISPLYNTNLGEQVCFETGTEIRIVVKENDTGQLVSEFVLDANELLDSVQLFFKLDTDNVEFYTYKLFNTYSWSKGTLRFTSPIREKKNYNIHKADTKRISENHSYHLEITETDNKITIDNSIEDLKSIKFNEVIHFFIVDKYDPNILYDKFSLDEKSLKGNKIIIDLDVSLKDKSVLYNNKYVSVLIKE
jgi:hypothetical protein